MDLVIDRWLHATAGIAWLGLLYYFLFIQAPALARARADGTAEGIVRHVAPRALAWFRWASVATWLTGFYYLERTIGAGKAFLLDGAAAPIGLGAWLGTIMLLNVWLVIWPLQKRVLGLVEASAEEKARAARLALLASRTNLALSFPMLFFMVAAPHGSFLFF